MRGDASFAAVLRRTAVRGAVLLTVGDRGYLPMLRNFVATSILRLGLRNLVVVAMDSHLCGDLLLPGHFPGVEAVPDSLVCWTYPGGEALQGGEFGSKEFATMVNIKSEMVLESVRLGYHTLLVDGDIVFFKDPLAVLLEQSPDAGRGLPRWDLQIQDDAVGGRNSGFMFVKASPWGLTFICESYAIAKDQPGLRQQPAVNQALKGLAANQSGPVAFTVRVLDDRFPCGMKYFEGPHRRMYADDHVCTDCVLMHNNWIVGTTAKVFRFRESLQWVVDTPSGWYSDPTAKYLQYSTVGAVRRPDLQGIPLTLLEENATLATAFRIAYALKRILILPEFRCHGCSGPDPGGTKEACSGRPGDLDRCSFMAHFKIKQLLTVMSKKYPFREHMFRYNPLVPSSVRLPATGLPGWPSPERSTPRVFLAPPGEPALYIQTPGHPPPPDELHATVFSVPSSSTDAIAAAFEAYKSLPVLHLAHLKALAVQLPPEQEEAFQDAWRSALTPGHLRQFA